MTAAELGPVTVLIVDDEPDVRRTLRALLERHDGFMVVGEAGDGAQATSMVEQLQPEVVLLDLMMPTPGHETLPHLLRVGPSTMIVVVSGADVPDSCRDRLLDCGAFAYYPKTAIAELPQLLSGDLERFRLVLDGEDGPPSWIANAELSL